MMLLGRIGIPFAMNFTLRTRCFSGPWNDTEEQTLQPTITEERATTMAANQENAEATEQRVQLANRSKRPVIKPSYLRDYV